MATVYEHGTLASLMAGNMAGTITLKELLKHGSEGLGTFEGVDGEVVFLDGEVYQADSTGTVHHVTNLTITVPFATVHFPSQAPQAITIEEASKDTLETALITKYQLQNVFAYVRVHGFFKHVKVRIAPKQEPPYPSLLEVAKHQPTFEREKIEGSLVGYYSPAVFGTVTAAGWHLHFISDDRQFEGHVLEFTGGKLDGNLEIFDSFEQHLPVNDPTFRQSKVNLATLKADIHTAEG